MRRVHKLIALMLCYILSISALIHPMAIYASTLQMENASNEQQDEQEQEQGQEEGAAPESTEGSGSVDISSSGQSDDQQENAGIPDGESVDSEPQSVDSFQSDQPEQDAEAASDDVVDKEQDKANSWRYKDGERIDVQSEDNGISTYSMDALPSGATAQGIDVSVWQGDIDWQKVKDAGIDFAIIRLGYWTNGTDKKLERNVSECERLGIPWGAYLYSYCSDPSQAAAEADHAIDLLNQLKAKGYTPDLPVYFDMEDDDLLSGSRDFAGMATQFCSKIEAAGYTAGVYANKNWWTNYLTSSVFNNWSRWVAQYNSVCTYGGSYDAWQYTSSGSVPGISGGVDMNWWYGESINGVFNPGAQIAAEANRTAVQLGEQKTGIEQDDSGRYWQHFANGAIYCSEATGAHAVWGPIYDSWISRGGVDSNLGLPVSSLDTFSQNGGGYAQGFEGGSLHCADGSNVYAVMSGPIRDEYVRLGFQAGKLGWPVSEAEEVAGGSVQRFQNGVIASSANGAFEMDGEMLEFWEESGGAEGDLGWPVTRAAYYPQNGGGYAQDFERGSIHWHWSSDASERTHSVLSGPIRDEYVRLGFQAGKLGWPVSEAEEVAGGSVQRFQNGVIAID